jgi:hypothetical protein
MNRFLHVILSSVLLFLLTSCENAPETPTGELFVLSHPDGAIVELQNEFIGLTPIQGERIPVGKSVLTVRKDGYKTEQLSIHIATNQKLSREVHLRPVTGLVVIRSNPAGANVTIDDVYKGKTPLSLYDVELGTHRAQLQMLGYDDREVEFEVTDRIPFARDVDMISNSGTLLVHSQPSGATLYIDGRNEGITPQSIERIQQGERVITLEMPGFEVYTRNILVESGKLARIDASLAPLPGGLSIATLPSEARVYVNGELKGESPVNLTDLTPGAYSVRVEKRGYAEQQRSVQVGRGTAIVEEFRLERNSGTLQIVTLPAGVRVNIDGEYMGTTQAPEGRSDRVSLPLQIDMLSRGSHTLQLVREGYTFQNKNFFITQDKVTVLEETLERKFIPNIVVSTGEGEDETRTGVLVRRHLNGDIEIEIRPGVYRTIPAEDIIKVEALKQEETLDR